MALYNITPCLLSQSYLLLLMLNKSKVSTSKAACLWFLLALLIIGCDTGGVDGEGPDASLNWEQIGAPFGGTIYASVRTQQNTLIVSEDEGMFWSDAGSNKWHRATGSSPWREQQIIEDASGRLYTTGPQALFISNDGGKSWTEKTLPFTIEMLAVGPGDNLYAFTVTHGIQHTMDGGETWSGIPMVLEGEYGLSNYRLPTFIADERGNLFIALAEKGVFRYLDNASSWEATSMQANYIQAINVSSDGVLYALDEFNTRLSRSTDLGTTWETMSGDWPMYSQISAIDTDDQGYVYVGLQRHGLFVSRDQGNSWQSINWVPPAWISHLNITGDGTLLAGTDEGLWRVDVDDGASHQIGVTLAEAGTVFVYDNVLFSSFNALYGSLYQWQSETNNWSRLPHRNGHVTSWTAVKQYSALVIGTVYGIEAESGSLLFSYDGGDSWTEGDFPNHSVLALTSLPSGEIVAGMGALRHIPRHLGGGVYISRDGGQSWEFEEMDVAVSALVALPNNGLLAGGIAQDDSGYLYRSKDKGKRWQRFSLDRNNPGVRALATDSRGYAYAGTVADGIYRSIDGGNVWKQVASNLVNIEVSSFVVDQHGSIYAGTAAGVYASSNGLDWHLAGEALAGLVVRAVAIGEDNAVYAGTSRQGIYRAYGK